MQTNKETLKIISNETKDSINQMSVVTPSMYASIFGKFALDHNTSMEDEKNLASDLIMQECSLLTNMQNETARNVQKLSEHTHKAISAIQNKDESSLKDVLRETQELRNELNKLKETVYRDELTHSFNRKWLNDQVLNEDIQSFKASGTLAIIDLNYFKKINDTHGHIVGDKVLVYIANQLKKTGEPVIRYGGDEFVVIFSGLPAYKNALLKLNEIREDILHKQIKVKDATFRVSFSIGIQEFNKDDDLANIIEQADKNMYEDKITIKQRITGI